MISLNGQFSIARVLVILLAMVLLIVLGRELELHLGQLEQDLQALGVWAPLGFIGLFVVLVPLGFSVDALCFIGGLLFPLLSGELYMMLATYVSSAVIFGLGRSLFKRKLTHWLERQPKFQAILSRQVTFKLMFLLRLTPLPFALLGYAFAAASVRFGPYLAATTGIFIYNGTLVYLGYTTKHLVGFAAGETLSVQVPYPLMALGLALLLAIMFYVGRRANLALKNLNQ